MSQFHTSDFSFLAHRPGQSSTQQAASPSPAAGTETIPNYRQQIKLPDAPALAVRKTSTPLPPAPRQPTPQSQHTQSADMPQQQALPMQPVLSAAPAWKRMARSSPHIAADKAAGPLKDRLATLVNTPAQPGQAVQKHVAGVLPAHSVGPHPVSNAQAAKGNGTLHTEQASRQHCYQQCKSESQCCSATGCCILVSIVYRRAM